MEKILEIIADTPLFNGLPEDQLRQIAQIAINRYYEKGTAIFLEGEECVGFFVIVQGSVKVFKLSADGKEAILHIFGPGEPFGEVPVFTGTPFPANAEVIAKAHLLFFPRKSFVDLISKNPSLALNMLAILSKRLRHFTIQIESLSLKEVSGRLASYLITLSNEQSEDGFVTLNISKGQLASLLWTIPETLSRIFAKMTAQNLIDVAGRKIWLKNLAGIKDLAELGKELE